LTKTILFDRKIFRKDSPKTACILIKLAPKNENRNSKKIPQRNEKKTAQMCGKTAQLATLLIATLETLQNQAALMSHRIQAAQHR